MNGSENRRPTNEQASSSGRSVLVCRWNGYVFQALNAKVRSLQLDPFPPWAASSVTSRFRPLATLGRERLCLARVRLCDAVDNNSADYDDGEVQVPGPVTG